ncbi:MAG: hypothetical protein ACLT38_03595 [Akkermansia sp.]
MEYEELGGVQANSRCPWCMKASASAGNTAWASCWLWEGSVIDSAKAIALGVPHEGDV